MILKTLVAFAIFVPSVAYSYNQFEVGKAAGLYIGATDMLTKLKQSECGYIIKKPVKNIDDVKKEILAFTNKSDREAINEYFHSNEFKLKLAENSRLVNQAITTAKSSTDRNTACGLAVGSLLSVIKTGEDAWVKQKKKP